MERSELARSSLPGVTISGSMASLAGLEEHPGRGDREAEHEHGRQRARGDQGHGGDERRRGPGRRDHEPALVEPVDDDAGECSEEHVGEGVQREHRAGPQRRPGGRVHQPREGERREAVAHLGDELAGPEQQEAGVAVERRGLSVCGDGVRFYRSSPRSASCPDWRLLLIVVRARHRAAGPAEAYIKRVTMSRNACAAASLPEGVVHIGNLKALR